MLQLPGSLGIRRRSGARRSGLPGQPKAESRFPVPLGRGQGAVGPGPERSAQSESVSRNRIRSGGQSEPVVSRAGDQ